MTKQQDLMKNSLIKEISNAYVHYIKPFSNQADVIVSSVLSAFHAFSYHHVNYEKKFSTTNMKELLNCPEGFVEMFLDLTLIN